MLRLLLSLTVLAVLRCTALPLDPQCPAGAVPFPSPKGVTCEDAVAATREATTWLRDNMPPFDEPNADTFFVDGIVTPTVNLSLTARQLFPWAAAVPRSVWQSGVLPYASVNEARTDWRQLMWEALIPLMTNANTSTLEAAALLVNREVWTLLGRNGQAIKFKSEQTPLIYDPMSTIAFGYASCTGVSLTYIAALRTMGIPARLVGTPAWNGNVSNGNHNWVEVWLGGDVGEGEWAFIEGAPAGSGEDFRHPTGKWFCSASKMQNTEVFATEWAQDRADVRYPMAWDLKNTQIPGVNRTSDYRRMCGVK